MYFADLTILVLSLPNGEGNAAIQSTVGAV